MIISETVEISEYLCPGGLAIKCIKTLVPWLFIYNPSLFLQGKINLYSINIHLVRTKYVLRILLLEHVELI